MYAEAGYVDASQIEAAIYDLFMASSAYGTHTYFAYDSHYSADVVRYQSARIKKSLIRPEFHHLLEDEP
jgi:hypothetical protein